MRRNASQHAKTNPTRSFEKMIFSYFQRCQPACTIENDFTIGQRQHDSYSVDGVWNYCNTVFVARGCHYNYFACREARPSLTDSKLESAKKKESKVRCVRVTYKKRYRNC